MCGIAALFASGASGDLLTRVGDMADAAAHRGPDDEGYVFVRRAGEALAFGGPSTPEGVLASRLPYSPDASVRTSAPQDACAALGHRRLSIIDISPGGHQPMSSADRRHWIVYNGEIYNHLELRRELQAAGHRFLTGSDTEVILAAYRQWGRECLHRFNGMFAFVLLDTAEKRVFVARDRFGVKPLYYWRGPAGFLAFASEIKQFSVLPGWQPRLNAQRAYDFLAWGLFDHTDETLFAGVRQLRGGEFIECGLDALEARVPVERWYHLQPTLFEGAFEDATREFRKLFFDSVRLRLRADVSVGSCLSGGLDSSAVVCAASRLLLEQGSTAPQKTFSARSNVARFDEGPYMEAVVAASGVDGHHVYPDLDELFAVMDELAWLQDEPFASTSIFAQWCVFRLAATNGIKVMLDGQGADELLAGYPGYLGPRLAALLRRGRIVEFSREIATAGHATHASPAYAAKQVMNVLLPNALRQPLRAALGHDSTRPGWLDCGRLGAQPREPFLDAADRPRDIRALSLAQVFSTHLPMLLHWEDRSSMAHSVEARVPFLDYRLAELALALPDEHKLHRGVTKRVLREAMQDILPDAVRTRRDKLGFATPEEVWMRSRAPERFRAELDRSIGASGGIIRPQMLQNFDDMAAQRRSFSARFWRAISFGAWVRRFGVGLG